MAVAVLTFIAVGDWMEFVGDDSIVSVVDENGRKVDVGPGSVAATGIAAGAALDVAGELDEIVPVGGNGVDSDAKD